ncbi:MAG: hypothetical protein CSB44_09685 [Gammaproteobacteria bacterium]|nr:MAG: hypothetical protein CSB44_09685 [Gammaproteobacteria bacterium]
MKNAALATSTLLFAGLGPALPAVAGPAVAAEAPLDDACWELTFDESFDTLRLEHSPDADDTYRWKTSYIWPRDVIINEELQYYVDPTKSSYQPFSVDDGILTIRADRRPASIAAEGVEEQEYLSGVLTTENGFSQQYGRFEVMAKVPNGRGLWSAFWLLPSFERWPKGVSILPEIDVMEHLGHAPRTFYTTLHTNQAGQLDSYSSEHRMKVDLSEDFHLYSVVWDEDSVDWYFDGRWLSSEPTPKDYTRPVHFLLNLAVGGNWPGAPDVSTVFPAEYQIDYVRAWKRKQGC